MRPTSIGGLEITGVIGTDGDVVTYAAHHDDHGTVAVTLLAKAARGSQAAVSEFLDDAQTRADDPADELYLAHGVDDGVPHLITKIAGSPTIHELPPPVNRRRRFIVWTTVAVIVVASIFSLATRADTTVVSPDERSWAIDLDGGWELAEGEAALTIEAIDLEAGLQLIGEPSAAPDATTAIDLVRIGATPDTEITAVDVEDQLWDAGVDVRTPDGTESLIRVIERPCATFQLTVSGIDGPLSEEQREVATGVADTFRRIGEPAAFEKGAEPPAGFVASERNGVRLQLPARWTTDAASADCLTARTTSGEQQLVVRWMPGLDETDILDDIVERRTDAGDELVSEVLTSLGKQRRVLLGAAGATVVYAIEDGSGVYTLEFANDAEELSDSDLLVFDLIASTFEVTG